ncbi:putative methyltransferase [Cladophialophora carrionii]|uniref:Putative methyltransferase n=1 Tax=Cladophialophora carrionii TaxID=86049 RepID=A0A1C1CNP8_9EURO|nr:putative methyltransferase [Cladophialophora carrionii]
MSSKPSEAVLQASASCGYTQGHSAAVIASHASRTVHNSAAFLLPHLKPDFTVLDLGCGPGTITRGFCSYVPQGKVIGIDAAESVIEQALSSAPTAKYPNLSFQVGDITARLPFNDGSVDVVYTSQTILHLPAPVAVMKEAHRVLKPGGMLAMRETDSMVWHPSSAGTEAYCVALGKAVPPGAQGSGTGRRLHVWAKEAGFSAAKMQVGTGGMCYAAPDLSRWWADVHVQRLRGEVGKKWLEDLKLVRDQNGIDEMVAGLKAWGDNEQAWYAAFQGEVICWK